MTNKPLINIETSQPSDNTIEKNINEKQKRVGEQFKKEISAQLSLLREETKRLEEIAYEVILGGLDNYDHVSDLFKKYESFSERNFLKRKNLSSYLYKLRKKPDVLLSKKNPDATGLSKMEIMSEQYIKFILPELATKENWVKGFGVGDHIKCIMQYLLEKKYNEEYVPKIDEATIIFEHHFNSHKVNNDLDNLESKIIIDSFNGLIIPDDNMESINTCHFCIPDKNAYTIIHILDKDITLKWLLENPIWRKNFK